MKRRPWRGIRGRLWITPLILICMVGLAAALSGCGPSEESGVAIQSPPPSQTPTGATVAAPSQIQSTTTSKRPVTTNAGHQGGLVSAGEAPSPRMACSLVNDPASGRLILFGGFDWGQSGDPLNDTWAYDPAANVWTELNPAGSSPWQSYGPNMIHDPRSGKMNLLMEGFGIEAWTYDPISDTWTQQPIPADDRPDARRWHSVVYDPTNEEVILFGGRLVDNPSRYEGLLAYDPAAATWTELAPSGDLPPARDSHAMVCDPVGGKMILFGGGNATGGLNDTWAYDPAANVWTELSPAGEQPSARSGHSPVYDPTSRRMVFFGGAAHESNDMLDDTWAYDPTANTWAELHPTGERPSPRWGHSMVYDPVTRRMILFGGMDKEGLFNDTWAYDPATDSWTLLANPATP